MTRHHLSGTLGACMPWDPHLVSPTLGRRYPNAPIVEAVMDVRAAVATEISVDGLKEVHQGEEERYPEHQLNFLVSGGMLVNQADVTAGASKRLNGHVYRRADVTQVYQARLDGFTFSRLAPYEHWEAFFAEGMRLWRRYAVIARPPSVERLALRYINRIDPPVGQPVEMSDYLLTRPEMSPLLPQTLDGFFLNAQLSLGDGGPILTLIETVVPSPTGGVSLILDIDVAYTQALRVGDDIDDILTSRFSSLRDAKNGVFEACITDRARSLFL